MVESSKIVKPMNTYSIFFKAYSRLLQRIPAPHRLRYSADAKCIVKSDVEPRSDSYGAWKKLSSRNISEALNSSGELKSDFLRQPSISQTVHPNQRSVGVRIGRYLANSVFGSHLLSTVSESLYGQPYLIQPDFPCFSSSGLQNLSYIHLVFERLGINLVDSHRQMHFVDYGAGYGNMARFLVLLSSNIRVSILDLPEMLRIQRLYHSNTIPLASARERIKYCESQMNAYHELASLRSDNHLHFNATFSLNESPVQIRECVEETLLCRADSFFIAYSPEFYGIDNVEWANKIHEKLSRSHCLVDGILPGYKTSSFIAGKKILLKTV